VKAKPVVNALQAAGHCATIYVTAQNPQLVDQQINSPLPKMSSILDYPTGLLSALEALVLEITAAVSLHRADLVLVIGDTSTALAGAIAGNKRKCAVAHLEAGMRSFDLKSPFPEEFYRCWIDQISDIHFCVSEVDCSNLMRERGKFARRPMVINHPLYDLLSSYREDLASSPVQNIVIFHLHRRELTEQNYLAILESIRQMLPIEALLITIRNRRFGAVSIPSDSPRLQTLQSQTHLEFVKLLVSATMIVSDSGGVQEECYAFDIPHIIAREATERPYLLYGPRAHLAGCDAKNIATIVREAYLTFSSEVGAHRVLKSQLTGGGKHLADALQRDSVLNAIQARL
jgi:UDP-N-acetylglucosamine 2-epimerase (non-hydrolysing)